MRVIIFAALLCSILLTELCRATECQRQLVSRTAGTLSNPVQPGLARIAHELGMHYLMIRMTPERLEQLFEAQGKGEILLAATTGHTPARPTEGRDVSVYTMFFDHSMAPLYTRDRGKWAHQLMAHRNDSIGMGVRYKISRDWQVGLIFPAEILDHYRFEITSTAPATERWRSVDFRLRRVVFKSDTHSPEDFRELLSLLIQNPTYPESFDVENNTEFHFSEPLPAWTSAMVWLPEPVVTKEPLEVPIYGPRLSAQAGLNHLRPPAENTHMKFEPDESLGSWFNTVPDWEVVRAELEARPRRARPFLPFVEKPESFERRLALSDKGREPEEDNK